MLSSLQFSRFCLLVWLSVTLCVNIAFAQDSSSVKKLINTAQNYQSRFPLEKLYLHLDRPNYTTYDTIWFKAYLFNSNTYSPSKLSRKVYIELINDSSRVVNRFAIPLASGLGQGHIVLDDKITDGTYTLRAYTNWMQNFGEEVFFNKRFYVGKPSDQGSWLINEQHTVTPLPNGNQISLALKLTTLNKAVIPYRDVELRLMEGKKTVFKKVCLTTDGGSTMASFVLPQKAGIRKLTLIITDKNTRNTYSLPFYPRGAMQDIDLQFMPESGNFITGFPSRVAFKAIGEDGLGTNIKGIIVNNLGQQVSSFVSVHYGIGAFTLLPQANETYAAKFELNGVSHSVSLPLGKPTGLNLRIDNTASADSVYIHVMATPDIAQANQLYGLVIQSAGGVYMGLSFKMNSGFTNIPIAKKNFASGIVSFTIIDADNKPVCKRLAFIDHHDRMNLEIANSKPAYKTKDSVALSLNVCDAYGRPVIGSFSVAVTDDAFLKDDTLADNIVSRLLLTSELRGYIENPNWYFSSNGKEARIALDNLMLAQGWTAFDWQKAVHPAAGPQFKPEPDNRLTGNLRNLFNKPVKDAKLSLFSVTKKYGLVLLDTISDTKGEFAFENLPLFDTIAYTLRVNNKKDKASGATVNVDIFKPAVVKANDTRLMPWFANVSDSTMLGYFNRPQAPRYNGIDMSEVKGKLLKEVKIKAGKPSIIAEGYSGFVTKEILEKDLVEAGKTTLYDLLLRKMNSFGMSNYYKEGVFSKISYHETPALVLGTYMIAEVIVDGQGTRIFSDNATLSGNVPSPQAAIDFMKTIGADDVKNIKIAEGFQIFIVITTRGGKGHFTSPSPNVLAYRPMPYCLPKQFYRPKYGVKSTVANIARPTIHWEPELITDGSGKAMFSFYAADKPGSYTVIIEGTDMNGNFGRQTGKIVISPTVTANKSTTAK